MIYSINMNVIYKVTDTLNNLSYIGSKMNYVENSEYLGSPSCREGHPRFEVQQLFINTVKNNKDKIVFEILEIVGSNDVKQVRLRETFWQRKFNATQSPNFINGIYANATGRSCKKIFCIDLSCETEYEFNSIKECEETLNINNVGAVVLGKRPSSSNKVCMNEEEYYANQADIIEYAKNKYKQQISKVGAHTVSKTIFHLDTGNKIQCTSREVFYKIKENNLVRKRVFIYDTLLEDTVYLYFLQTYVKEFTKNNLQKFKVLNENTNVIYSYKELCKIYSHREIKLHLQGINKTLNKEKFRIVK